MRRALIPILAAPLLMACGAESPTMPSATLTEVEWRLQTFELSDGTQVTIDDPSKFTATFGEDGSLGARADCNVCNGSYELTGNAMEIGLMACTLAYCGEASHHDRYLRALQSSQTFDVTGDRLFVEYDGGRLRFLAQ